MAIKRGGYIELTNLKEIDTKGSKFHAAGGDEKVEFCFEELHGITGILHADIRDSKGKCGNSSLCEVVIKITVILSVAYSEAAALSSCAGTLDRARQFLKDGQLQFPR
jgi:hypothetical protein